jgi:hypothetical protein
MCSSRSSAAITKVLAESWLEEFQSSDIRLSFSGSEALITSENLFGMYAAANCSTFLLVSASMARQRADSFPAINIPLIMRTVYK